MTQPIFSSFGTFQRSVSCTPCQRHIGTIFKIRNISVVVNKTNNNEKCMVIFVAIFFIADKENHIFKNTFGDNYVKINNKNDKRCTVTDYDIF